MFDLIIAILLLVVILAFIVYLSSKTQTKQGGKDIDKKYYYHGSEKKINELEPRPSKVINNEKAVFAINNKYLAAVFIPKWNDNDMEFGYHNGVWYLHENKKSAFDIYKTASGFIHYVQADLFKSDKRLGLQGAEFIAKQNVNVEKIEKINNVWEFLQKSDIKFIKFGEPKPWKTIIHNLSFFNPTIDGVKCDLLTSIRNGIKTVEGRKNSSKYQNIVIGDYFRFKTKNEPDVVCRITYIHKYNNIKEYLETETLDATLPCVKSFDLTHDKSFDLIEHGIKIYNKFVSNEEVEKLQKQTGFGFIGFGIKVEIPQ